MTSARLVVEQAGPLTTYQDGGRPGHARFGVPRSGPVDPLAFRAAHAALGNPGGTLIELSLGGITLACVHGAVAFALTGGDSAAEVDGSALGAWTAGRLAEGQRLRVRAGSAGNWACLAFAGQVITRRWLGSAATHALSGLGGGALATGDTVEILSARTTPEPGPLPRPDLPDPDRAVRVVPGPQQRYFDEAAIETLTVQPFGATAAFDRMGMVLDGPALLPRSLDMLSEPAVAGSLQANGRGQLTLLLADHQTSGGYPKIATVISADRAGLAQRRAGRQVRFQAIDVDTAVRIVREDAVGTDRYLRQLARRAPMSDRLSQANLIDGAIDAMGADAAV